MTSPLPPLLSGCLYQEGETAEFLNAVPARCNLKLPFAAELIRSVSLLADAPRHDPGPGVRDENI
jgi:hypothetical protein